jgi:hypothetical protein
MNIGKQLKRMVRAFYGRVFACQQGLVDDDGSLPRAALARNFIGTAPKPDPFLGSMAIDAVAPLASCFEHPVLLAGHMMVCASGFDRGAVASPVAGSR